MQKINCILLGAGASRDAGVPTSREILTNYKAIAPSKTKNVVDYIIGELSKGTSFLNIEDVAKKALDSKSIEVYNHLKRFTLREISRHKNCQYLKTLFSLDLDALYGFSIREKPIWRLSKDAYLLAGLSTTRVFSLNYDLTIEDAISVNDPYMGLFSWIGQKKSFVFEAGKIFNLETGVFENPPSMLEAKDRISVPRKGIYKLHGSLSWRHRTVDGKRVLTSHNAPGGNAEIIFGQQLKLRLTSPYNELFYAFSKSLSICQALIIIGYSWSDSHINDVIFQESRRGMKVLEISTDDPRKTSHFPLLADDAIFIKSNARHALLGKDVDVACGTGRWKSMKGGLVGVVRKVLQKQLWKTEEEWKAYRKQRLGYNLNRSHRY